MSSTPPAPPLAPAPASPACDSGCAPRGTLSPLDVEDLAQLLKALAHPARIEIFRHLSAYGACYFGNLSDVTGLAPSTTSQHVKVLKDAGLVRGSAEEQRTCYCIDPERLARLRQLVGSL